MYLPAPLSAALASMTAKTPPHAHIYMYPTPSNDSSGALTHGHRSDLLLEILPLRAWVRVGGMVVGSTSERLSGLKRQRAGGG